MTWKHVSLIVIFILFFIGGKIAYNALFGESDTCSFEESDWKKQTYLGVSFEAPFELSTMNIPLPEEVKKLINKFDTYEFHNTPIGMAVSVCEYKEGTPANIDGSVQGAVQNMQAAKGVTDFKYEVTTVDKGYLQCRRIVGTMKLDKKDAEFISEIYLGNMKLLQIMWENLNYAENRAVRDRILKSIKIDI